MSEAGRRIFRPDLLEGQVALVTGGGTGIGLGIASCLAAAGATVAIASRKPEHLEPAAAELRGHGARVTTVETNVREPEAVARMVEQVTADARTARHPGQQCRGQLLRAVGHASRPTPGARSSRPISTAASTVRRRSTPS